MCEGAQGFGRCEMGWGVFDVGTFFGGFCVGLVCLVGVCLDVYEFRVFSWGAYGCVEGWGGFGKF